MIAVRNACKTTFTQENKYSAWLGVGGGIHFHTHTHTVRYTELCMHAHTVRTLTNFFNFNNVFQSYGWSFFVIPIELYLLIPDVNTMTLFQGQKDETAHCIFLGSFHWFKFKTGMIVQVHKQDQNKLLFIILVCYSENVYRFIHL